MSLKTFINKSVPSLYMTELSPPVRSVLMTAHMLGLPLYKKEVNLITGDNKTASYLKASKNENLRPLQRTPNIIDHYHKFGYGYLINHSAYDVLDESARNGAAVAGQRLLYLGQGKTYRNGSNIFMNVSKIHEVIFKHFFGYTPKEGRSGFRFTANHNSDDNTRILCHAISGYLVHEYGQSDSLYPKDSRKRALVDQRLHFDTGTLYPEFRNIVYPVIAGEKIITKDKINRVENAYKTFDSILANAQTKWLVGDQITIADLCNVATISTLELFIPSTGKYAHLENWLRSCKQEIPGYEEMNQRGLNKLVDYVRKLLTK